MPVPDTREHKTDFDENLEKQRIPLHITTRSQTKRQAKLESDKLKKEMKESRKKKTKISIPMKTTPEIPVPIETPPKRYERNPHEFYEGMQQEHKAKLKENLRKLKLDLLNQGSDIQNAYINWKKAISKIPFAPKKKKRKKKKEEYSGSESMEEEERKFIRPSSSSSSGWSDESYEDVFLSSSDDDPDHQSRPIAERTRSSTRGRSYPDIFHPRYSSPRRPGIVKRSVTKRLRSPERGPFGLPKKEPRVIPPRSRASSADSEPMRVPDSPRRSLRLSEPKEKTEDYLKAMKGLAAGTEEEEEEEEGEEDDPLITPKDKKKGKGKGTKGKKSFLHFLHRRYPGRKKDKDKDQDEDEERGEKEKDPRDRPQN